MGSRRYTACTWTHPHIIPLFAALVWASARAEPSDLGASDNCCGVLIRSFGAHPEASDTANTLALRAAAAAAARFVAAQAPLPTCTSCRSSHLALLSSHGLLQQSSFPINTTSLRSAQLLVPAGTFTTGGFNLSSNVALVLTSPDAELRASANASLFQCLLSCTVDTGPCDYPLVGAYRAANVAVLGPGRLNGGANDPPGHLVAGYTAETNYLQPQTLAFPEGRNRVKLLVMRDCRGVLLSGAQLANSALWTTTIVESSQVLLDGLTISGDRRWPNNDGVDLIGCTNATLRHTSIDTGDDCICLSSHTETPMDNVLIEEMELASTSAAIKIGHFLTATIANVRIQNSRIRDSHRGLAFMPRRGAGDVRNVTVTNVSMATRFDSPAFWGAGELITLTGLWLDTAPPDQQYTGTVSDISFTNIDGECDGFGVLLYAGNHTRGLHNLRLENIRIAVAHSSNWTQPALDLRPTSIVSPDMQQARIDGMLAMGDVSGLVRNITVTHTPGLPYYGACHNTSASPALQLDSLTCGA